MIKQIRSYIGLLIFDLPRYLRHLYLRASFGSWSRIKNRADRLEIGPRDDQVKCLWRWTSELYLPTKIAFFGNKIFHRAFADYPIDCTQAAPAESSVPPQISFIIGHRGQSRLPLLLKTIDSIAGQRDCAVECVVVEQDLQQNIRGALPDWVNYVFTPLPEPAMPYSRAWAFNVGAEHASADYVIFHDNDMLVPSNYAAETLKRFQAGYDFVNLTRFVFYLDKLSSERCIADASDRQTMGIDAIVQNIKGGGTFGASKAAFQKVGRWDERFVGWGGEDSEFWERAETLNIWQYGYLPIIHLWHESQHGKDDRSSPATQLYDDLTRISPQQRIQELQHLKQTTEQTDGLDA